MHGLVEVEVKVYIPTDKREYKPINWDMIYKIIKELSEPWIILTPQGKEYNPHYLRIIRLPGLCAAR